jgi:ribosomal protein S18 acetylase RimI-like enzyme
MPINSRSLAGDGDYALVRSLLIELAADQTRAQYCTIGDLDWWRSTDEDPENIRLMQVWLNAEHAVATVWPDNKSRADVIVHPDYFELLPGMLEWAEVQTLEANHDSTVTLETWSFSKDITRSDVLRARGYEQGQPAFCNFSLKLPRGDVSPILPPGYAIRDMREATTGDIQKRVDAHRAAFAPSEMTVVKHQRVMASPTYRPELDLVIATADGTITGFTIIWFDEVNRIGLFEPVGTHPDHQRRGLGRAIMAEGLRRLTALGATKAFVSTGLDNLGANALYTAIGFQAVDENVSWTKKLR